MIQKGGFYERIISWKRQVVWENIVGTLSNIGLVFRGKPFGKHRERIIAADTIYTQGSSPGKILRHLLHRLGCISLDKAPFPIQSVVEALKKEGTNYEIIMHNIRN